VAGHLQKKKEGWEEGWEWGGGGVYQLGVAVRNIPRKWLVSA